MSCRHDYCEYLDGPQSRIETGNRRILCKGGGGGGGDGGAAEREAARQARIAEGTAAVNNIFGIGGQTEQVKTGDRLIGYKPYSVFDAISPKIGNFIQPAISPDEYDKLINSGAQETDSGFQVSSLAPVYEGIYETVESAASKAAKQRQALYDTTKNDVRAFYTKQLEEDKAKAQRELDFNKARLGIIGSSQANDLDSEFQKRYDKGLLDVANRADTASTNFKISDETARLNLISKVVNGIDQGTAAQNAMSTLQTNANAANEAYKAERMANVFSDMFDTYAQAQYNAGTTAAKKNYGSTTGNYYATAGSNGTTSIS